MAVNIQQKFSIDLNGVVENSITAVKTVRKKEQAKKESEFQRAIANGLSYEEQTKMREKQLEDERKSQFADQDYIFDLEKSIADTKKLNRFNKYRTNYTKTFGDLVSGRINEQSYLDTLKNQLNNIADPELRLEIQQDVAAAEKGLKTYNDTILANQVKLSKNDGTVKTLSSIVARVTIARTNALLSDNEDEVTMHDETLSALNSQLSSVKIEDAINNFQLNSATRGINPVEKLDFINSEIRNADIGNQIKIGNKTYNSAQEFWTLERDTFLSGNSQIFGKFFDELNTYTKNTIDSATVKFGHPTQIVLDNTLQTFNDLKSKPELAPFVNKLDVSQAITIGEAVDKYASHLVNTTQGTKDFSFKAVDTELNKLSLRYGVDLTARRVQAQNISLGVPEIPEKEIPELDLKVPKVEEKPITTEIKTEAIVTPSAIPTSPTTGGIREIKTGDTLSGIAKETGVQLSKILELNPEFIDNPNLIRPGQQVKLPGEVAPAITTPKPEVTPAPPTAPVPTPEVKKQEVPAEVSQKTIYTGTSIVDYLKSQQQDTSFEGRKKLATEKGITDYAGTAQQNEELLKRLRT